MRRLPRPGVARKRLTNARRRRAKASPGTKALAKAREDVKRADKNLKMARQKAAFCRSQYKLARKRSTKQGSTKRRTTARR